jgi:fatty-acyl-CoA synthase
VPLSFAANCMAQAEALAGWLQAQGVQKGDRVLLFMQNCPQFVVAFYAMQRADAVVVPVNPMNRADEFGHYITDPEARVVLTTADLAGTVQQANERLPAGAALRHMLVTRFTDAMPAGRRRPREKRRRRPCSSGCSRPAAAGGQRHRCAGPTRWRSPACSPARTPPQPDDLALLPYTSGTTGLPKGCMHTHRTLMHNVVGGGLGASTPRR